MLLKPAFESAFLLSMGMKSMPRRIEESSKDATIVTDGEINPGNRMVCWSIGLFYSGTDRVPAMANLPGRRA